METKAKDKGETQSTTKDVNIILVSTEEISG